MTKLSKAVTPKELKSKIDPSPEVRNLRSQVQRSESVIDRLKLQIGEQNEYFSQLLAAVHTITPSPTAYTPSQQSSISPVSAVWHFTDWHIGEVIDEDEIEGFNAFNFEIAKKRVSHFIKTTLDWTVLLRHSYTIDELVIICSGDFISGDIHEELKRTNEFPVPVQVVKSGTLLGETIAAAAPHFKSVRVEFVTPDNHSRLTKKYQFKEGGLNSFNYIVGWIAQNLLSKHSNVKFNLFTGPQQVVRVQNYRYLVRHGHGIKGTWGIPYYGVERVTSQAAKARLNKPDHLKFDRLLIGHFHAPLKGPWWQIGGSLNGTSELDHAENRYAKPCQTTWLVHPKHGEFNYNEIWLQPFTV